MLSAGMGRLKYLVWLVCALAWLANGCSRSKLADLFPRDDGDMGAAFSQPQAGGSPVDRPTPTPPVAPMPVTSSAECSLICVGESPEGIDYTFEIATEFDGFPWVYCGTGDALEANGHRDCASLLRDACYVETMTGGDKEPSAFRSLYFEAARDGVTVLVDEWTGGEGIEGSTFTLDYQRDCEASDAFLRWASDLPPVR